MIDLFLLLLLHLSNSIWNTSISDVKSSWTSLYLSDSDCAAGTNGGRRRRRSLGRHESGGDGAGVLLGHVVPEAEAGEEIVAVAGADRGGGDELIGPGLQVVGHANLQGGPEKEEIGPLLV